MRRVCGRWQRDGRLVIYPPGRPALPDYDAPFDLFSFRSEVHRCGGVLFLGGLYHLLVALSIYFIFFTRLVALSSRREKDGASR